jgi:hypothetical protein
MLVVSGSTNKSTSSWLATRAMCDVARHEIGVPSRIEARPDVVGISVPDILKFVSFVPFVGKRSFFEEGPRIPARRDESARINRAGYYLTSISTRAAKIGNLRKQPSRSE